MTGRKVCGSCGAPIRWVHTGEHFMPLDADPHPDGNVTVEEDRWTPDGYRLMPRAHVAADDTPSLPGLEDDREPRYRPHAASCPQADEWMSL